MHDAEIVVPAEVRNGLVRAAQAKGRPLEVYLTILAKPFMTADEHAVQGERLLAYLKAWNGYDPTEEDLAKVDAMLERQCVQHRAGQ
ncbi:MULTISPECIES: hypothetical protein [unclassified Frankia]|uniref:hypothetical protein n=1 Tax=unclassified Frankia TaxID=2632575 RepID=UPI001EE42CFF|nr:MULTISPECIES: hypothetical protein [unclassified Frankia]